MRTPQYSLAVHLGSRAVAALVKWASCYGLLVALASGVARGEPAAPDISKLPAPLGEPVDFFRDIRPIFEANCFSCHGPEKQRSGFRLDWKAAALNGGDHGTAIIPGESAKSPLILFVAGLVEDMHMPPPKGGAKPLSSEQIALLRAWIDQGARWPESESAPAKPREDFWAFKPVLRPALPERQAQAWGRNEIDQFIAAQLAANGLSPSVEADKRTLIRRLAFDLTGLPPTAEETAAFLADCSDEAYERVVDRFLASPHYGERWARHWLDTIHYGETHGYDKDKPRPNAWPYRDYVIRSFNQDKPYSRFVEEQLAGDALFPDEPDGVVALGFLAAGPWDFVGHVELPESKTDGLIARYNDRDDMVMTTMSTLQSLTVHCARCHDHKFDPIPQAEYYGLQAVFAGVDRADRWFDPNPVVFQQRKRLLAAKKTVETRENKLQERITALSPRVFKLIDSKEDDLKKQLAALPKPGADGSPSNGYHSQVAERSETVKWVQVDLGKLVRLDEVRLIPARPTDFTDTPGFGFPVRFRVEIAEGTSFANPRLLLDQTDADYPNPGDQQVVIPAAGQSARLIRVTATRLWQRTGDYVFALAELEAQAAGQNVAAEAAVEALDSIESGRWAKKFLNDGFSSRKRLSLSERALAAATERRSAIEAELSELGAERQELVERLLEPGAKRELADVGRQLSSLQKQLAELPAPAQVYTATHDFAPMGSFRPAREPRPVHLLRRGEVKQPVRLAEPGALSCLPGLEASFELREEASEGERRAALAKWITNRSNMMTRRSIVNRVWQYHFGRGIVDSPNDFGHMGALPTHPELLDWLAFWFLDEGESLKKLHRLIVMSGTYRQASAHRAECARIDAENRYLWRMNRSRLDAESLRDSILEVAGRLDRTMGGPSVQQFFFKDDHSPVYDYTRFDVDSTAALRRSIYRFIVRSVPDPFMETMDCPDPSLLTPKRNTTVTALQALALLNDPFVLRQAEVFASALPPAGEGTAAQIEAAFRRALSRPPTPQEATRLGAYTQQHGTTNLCRLIFNTSEFMFID